MVLDPADYNIIADEFHVDSRTTSKQISQDQYNHSIYVDW